MAVTPQIPRNVSTAATGATVFPYDFKIIDKADLLVTVDGVAKVVDVDFGVSGVGIDSGGDITFFAPMAGGESVMRKRNMEYQRQTDYQHLGDLRTPTLNNDQDAPIMMLQQQAEELSRALRMPADYPGTFIGDLPFPAPLMPLVWNADGTALVAGDTVLTGDMLLRPSLADAGGAALVGFLQSGVDMVARSMLAKGRDIVHADDIGLVGDGVLNETAKLQKLFNAAQGKVLMLGYGKSYGIDPAIGLSIPANTTLIANGSKLKRLTSHFGGLVDSEFNIVIGNDTTIDSLVVDCVGGGGDIGGVRIEGSRVSIGVIRVNAPTAGSGSAGSKWNAIRIGPEAGTSTDVHVGTIECNNWDRPIAFQNLDRFSVGFVAVDTYCRGVYLKDVSNGVVRGGHIRTTSPNATGTAGENGVLLESTLSHGRTHDIRIENVTVEDSGEHGYRLGGGLISKNIWFSNCHAANTGTGTGTYPPGNNGGCGFKALGPTSLYGSRHQNIHFVDCSVDTIVTAGPIARGTGVNFAGFQMGKVLYGSIVNPIVRAVYADTGSVASTGYSSMDGIQLIGCEAISITNPNIMRPYRSGILLYDAEDVGGSFWGNNQGIVITGGQVVTPGTAGVLVSLAYTTLRRLNIMGGFHAGGGLYAVRVEKSGAGAIAGAWADVIAFSQTTESFSGCGDFQIQGRGNFVGANLCRNGSTYMDLDAGTLKYQKAGAWVSL